MKKAILCLLAVTLILSGGVTGAYAAPGARNAGFLDANADGICDTCGALDVDGDGLCDNDSSVGIYPLGGFWRRNSGIYFVDANGDGVCDNRQAVGRSVQTGMGSQIGGERANRGAEFVDANGDGVCDNRQTVGRAQNGARGGRQGSGKK